ncbi:response regulator transcription factor [uncultured Sphingomonas sp.]|uniref:response regulator transcription factor n=1 Tax=uncultured Sphingomonas sp. TaxID=158754 RepID=UPI0035CB5B2A
MARIIIVDDDDIIADIAVEVLAAAGHCVDVVDNGSEAIGAVLQSEADLVILDYDLPDKSGMQVLREIRELPGADGVAVLMMTARTGSLLALRAEQAGADDYMTKPFDPQDLLRRVEALLAGLWHARSAPRT